MNTPEYYGYKLGENIAPYINKCIDLTGECYISEGTHIIGRNDKNWNLGHVWSDSSICWGWNRKHKIKIIGTGRDKTILKWIDNCHAAYLFDEPKDVIVMVTTNWDESCDDNLIEGITFDGNYEKNRSTATLMGIRIRGENNIVKSCKFINFGVGSKDLHECFQIIIGPINNDGRGTQIIDNYFTLPGRKSNSTTNHVPENTVVAVGGVDTLVKGNVFENMDFNVINQQSPLHGISIGNTKNAKIIDNNFINFQGSCIYMDSWTNEDFIIKNNTADNVWQFLQMSCQHWDNSNQISFNKNLVLDENKINLSIGDCYWHWNKPPIVSNFVGYVNAPNVDHVKYPGFKNIVITKNKVTLGYRKLNSAFEESTKLFCFWGNSVGDDKIKMINNEFLSTISIPPKKKCWFIRLIEWIKNLFK
jgi:hypothetical protein